MAAFDEHAFRASVAKALVAVRTVLDTARNPELAAPEVAHKYADKYVLAEAVTATGAYTPRHCHCLPLSSTTTDSAV